MLGVKGNQGLLHEETKSYLGEALFEKQIKATKTGYIKTIESARSQIKVREYYQTDEIEWMTEKDRWKGLKTIGKVVTTVEKKGKTPQEIRYYISSLPVEATRFKRAVRGHWGIESFHWHLDVTFVEDANHTLNQAAARNLNIIRKMAIPMLKELPFDSKYKRSSLKTRRFIIEKS